MALQHRKRKRTTSSATQRNIISQRSISQGRTLVALFTLLFLSALTLAVPYLAAAPHLTKNQRDKKTGKKSDSQSTQNKALAGLPATDLTQDQAIVHALDRLGFGPRPGDLPRSSRWAWQSGSIGSFIPNP